MKSTTVFVVLSITVIVAKCESVTFLDKQEAVLEVFQHVYQRSLKADLYNEANSFKFEADKYYNPNVFEQFLKNYHDSFEEFNPTDKGHLRMTFYLVNLFLNAKDLMTFYKTVAWARYNVNNGMFVFALNVAINKRNDVEGISIPPIYEVNPYFFFNSKVIDEAKSYQMIGFDGISKVDGVYTVIILANYTGMSINLNQESLLTYFTEDVGLNAMFYEFFAKYPVWLDVNPELSNVFYAQFFHKILARYYLERLSNNLGKIPEFSWDGIFENGYSPNLRYYSGSVFPSRNNFVQFYNKDHYAIIDKIKTVEGILLHHYKDMTFKRYTKYTADYYYPIYEVFRQSNIPGCFNQFETFLRDPISYQFLKRLFSLIPYDEISYQKNELDFEGVKIDHVEMDRLVTYFDQFDSDITNVVDVNPNFDKKSAASELVKFGRLAQYKGEDFVIKARQWRLNHLPFDYKIHVESTIVEKAIIITFMGPKYDEYGRVFDINENRENFYEIDRFKVDLQPGKNNFSRNSKEFPNYSNDLPSYYDLYKNYMDARKGTKEFPPPTYSYLPQRLMLPKGNKGGFAIQFFFVIYPDGKKVEAESFRYYGYPLDRFIDENEWFTPNMYYYDTKIYHKNEKDTI